ncbi:TauD/TfdA family dioxygenase [Novosphingobium sp. TH158]|uniref:TauD/TfdA dioxygenase family protein n=1 Tax=Novosphingobium sp. TH158 TaxID=2067455 RepID=UPI000C7DB231|nr:TauD/TfdA family dioxygenase [Novosphingobium sp. TH158]PLK24490.1 taurine catabolism dioxygenase [Novosphingobium sp. TH158]
MTVLETTRLKYEEIKPNIGARVLNSKEELLSGELSADIRELIERKGVLVFKQVHFTNEEQVAFTRTLGTFMPEGEGEDVFNISLDPKLNANKDYLKGSLFWHADGTMNPLPIGYAILSSRVLPTWGGNTEFCNTYAAYDALDEETKAKIAKLKVMHAAWNSVFYYEPEPSQAYLEAMMRIGNIELPVVWTHKSGRKSLVLGCTAHHVVDMDWVESARLLNGLREWATSEPFHYAHEWEVGDAVMWDNTGTMHRARPYDPDCGRLLVRTKTGGEEPIV